MYSMILSRPFTDYVSQTHRRLKFPLELQVPGWSKDDITITTKGSLLEIAGKKGDKTLRYALTLENVDPASIQAVCKDGLLTISAKDPEPLAIVVT